MINHKTTKNNGLVKEIFVSSVRLAHQLVVPSAQRGSLKFVHSQLSGNSVRGVMSPLSLNSIFFDSPKVSDEKGKI